MKRLEQTLGMILLVFAIGFNLWLYRLEPTAKVDPNDNTFQYALVYRTNQIWDFAQKTCSNKTKTIFPVLSHLSFGICHLAFLVDHWFPNWNEGYNLPYYYSHMPQIVIVASYRFITLFSHGYSLFSYYHLIIYLLLCLFPLSVFLALLVLRSPRSASGEAGLPFLTAGVGALLASQISTDGLYGLDPSSFLWRGYGLSSQLFTMIFLPLAIAYAYRYISEKRSLIPAVIFLVLTTAGHLGIGILAFISLVPLAIAKPFMTFFNKQPSYEILPALKRQSLRLTILSAIAIFLLSYWILPAMLGDKFHNFSFWDPVWKFNSYGWKETVNRLFNGDLFDFGRLPFYTGLVLIGSFVLLSNEVTGLAGFALLFFFWFLLYFGRTTWGNILNIIPGMKEFHQSRFIVGVHLSGLFLAPIGLTWLAQGLTKLTSRLIRIPTTLIFSILLLIMLAPSIYAQTIRYSTYNDTLIRQANANYEAQAPLANELVTTLQKLPPGRVFAGRGGAWGKNFRIAETPMYMYLSNFGIPTVLWLPETWSPNGDTEQYFRENVAADYDLYNIRYVATPADLSKDNVQPFWKLIKETNAWKLYEVPSSGYFTVGTRPAVVASDKYSFTNVERLWIQSDDPKQGLYPELSFDTEKYPMTVGLPNFKMRDEVTFQVPASTRDESTRGGPDGSLHNVFAEPPRYMNPTNTTNPTNQNSRISNEQNSSDMIFSVDVTIPANCTECFVILKETYHPNWRATVDGKGVTPIIVFPFYLAIPVSPGTHKIVFTYQPSSLKIFLLCTELLVAISFLIWFLTRKLGIDKKAINIPH